MVSDLVRGNQLLRSGKLEEAIPAYQSVIAQNPAFYLAYQNLGESLEGLGRWEEAIINYRQAIKLNSNSALSHYQLGRALVKSGCLNQGIEVLNAGLKLKPGYHKYYEQLRNAWVQKGEWEKAIANHKKAIEINHSESLQTFDFIDYKSQLNQDKWVVMMTQGKQLGVFLEIGSTDGVDLNNTFCLEKVFSWSGICVEPNPDFFKKLCANRTAITFPYCFYKESGQIVEFIPDNIYGTISEFSSTDHHASRREKFVAESGTIKVITARPEDILNLYNFPEIFDFLSLDVEGAELDILECFNLSKLRPALACIEHNYVADKRLAIFELLSSYGYQRIECQWDDWYYNLDILKVLNPEIPISHYQRVLQYFCNYHDCKL